MSKTSFLATTVFALGMAFQAHAQGLPTPDCTSKLALDATQMAEGLKRNHQQSDFGTFGNAGISAACPAKMENLESVKSCLNALKEANDKAGGLDVLEWNRLRVRLLEEQKYGTCTGSHYQETLPHFTSLPRGSFAEPLDTSIEKMRINCSGNISSPQQCAVAITGATLATKDRMTEAFNKALPSLPSEEERAGVKKGISNLTNGCAQAAHATEGENIQASLQGVSRCVSTMLFTGYGVDRDILSLAYSLAYTDANKEDPLSNALKEISAATVALSLRM